MLFLGQLSISSPFQSTPPVKAATIAVSSSWFVSLISIHAAREGGDGINPEDRTTSMTFQSTPPVKAATKPDYFVVVVQPISIHAAREGGDFQRLPYKFFTMHFNPRRP